MLYFLLPDNANKLVMARLDEGTNEGFVSCVMHDNTVETYPMPANGLREVVDEVKANRARFQTLG